MVAIIMVKEIRDQFEQITMNGHHPTLSMITN